MSKLPVSNQVIKFDISHSPAADTITLDETGRHRRRMKLLSDAGIEFLLDLPVAQLMHHGDGLLLDDKRIILVQAKPENLMEITARDYHHLLQLTWQLGNRHLATQIEDDRLLIRADQVIAEMLIGLGAKIRNVSAPFSPQGGAYGATHHDHD